MRKSDLDYYPSSYSDSRRRFLSQAQSLQRMDPSAVLSSFQVPSRSDQDLFVDSFYLPATKSTERLLVMTSGVHGLEAYTGSAIQQMFIDEVLPDLDRSETGVFLVHSLNPFGFKHHRRSTENNVNLNRNFSFSPDLFQSPNEAYERLAEIIELKGPLKGRYHALFSTLKFLALAFTRLRFTGSELNQAIAQGQFRHPKGVEYGGLTWEPQTADFQTRLQSLSTAYRDLILFDLHTGLGHRYSLHLIPGDESRTVHPDLLNELFDREKESHLYSYTTTDTEGFYRTNGDLNAVVAHLASGQKSDQKRVLALTFEFGTLGNGRLAKIQTLSRLLGENQAFHFGYTHPSAEKECRRDYEELFFPSEPKWRLNAIERTRKIFINAVARINARSHT